MNRRDFLTKVIVGLMIRKGYLDIRSMHRNAVNARAKNEKLLFRILDSNRDTEYGKRYHFDRIHSIEDYKRLVPLSSYDDYAPYIERMVNQGEKGLITTYPIVQYAETSGSIGVPKKIPVSKQLKTTAGWSRLRIIMPMKRT